MKLDNKSKIAFSQQLLAWYRESKRDLPWRKTSDPYKIWVAEVMLQQTQVETVLPYYDRFLQRFPDIAALAAAQLVDVLKIWEGLGYYARARNLHKAATRMVAVSGGVVPATHSELLQIPGIGPYTAAAVASIAFGENHAVVDGNVVRVLSRILKIEKSPAEKGVKARVSAAAAELLPHGQAGDFNQAMMELGATVCTPARPACDSCPVATHCLAYESMDDPSVLPVKKRPKEKPHYDIGVGIVWRDGKILIDQRPENGLLGGLWELPGGKQEADETIEECVEREIREKFGLIVRTEGILMTLEHAYTHFRITLHAFQCKYLEGTPNAKKAAAWQWVRPAEINRFPFPRSNLRVLTALQSEIE